MNTVSKPMAATMPVKDDIDALRASVTTISRNLLDLAQLDAVKIARVRVKDAADGYLGATRDQVSRALASLDALWTSYLLIARVLDEASALNKRDSVFRDTDKEVRALLHGPSVELHAEHIPIASRGLLTTASHVTRASPAEVLAAMTRQFDEARELFNVLAEALERSGARVNALRQRGAELDAWSRRIGAGERMPVNLDSMLRGVDRDPLSCAVDIDRAERMMTAERQALANLEQRQALTRAAIEEAGAMLAQTRDCARQAAASIDESRRRIREPAGLVTPVDEAALASLGEWLDALKRSAREGHHEAVRIGLVRWQGACLAQLEAARQACVNNRLALDECVELAGRFSALRAMARSFAARGVAQDATLETTKQEVRRIIEAEPVALPALRTAIGAFEAAVYNIKPRTAP